MKFSALPTHPDVCLPKLVQLMVPVVWIPIGSPYERDWDSNRQPSPTKPLVEKQLTFFIPRDPITLSEDDWGVQSLPQQSI